ncbi:hypothetical protein AJ79_01871 [Helicocarpus griseus UAMH5409]|uniref:AB hydrolase-1 domain-containing protein n=1 Tax=Helicocarpus griseus UAMH5409 TaxID=1447875 RepID=A0A2B7Y5C1_9EURO|nr:hypothetical protein AJ79_01871 [Helicocarpus griseus UAMH5409]
MISSPKPTVVLVHGANHTPAIYDPILSILHAASYPTITVSLPSSGASPGLPDFSADTEAVRTVVKALAELGREVLMVPHSYGGMPSTEALLGSARKNATLKAKTVGSLP